MYQVLEYKQWRMSAVTGHPVTGKIKIASLSDDLHNLSQVTSLVWSRDGHEILSSHGQPNNQLTLWQYPSLTKVADLKGHRGRVLHIAVSPKRTRVASAGADETLRVWKCFEPAPPPSRHSSYLEDSMSSMMISGIY